MEGRDDGTQDLVGDPSQVLDGSLQSGSHFWERQRLLCGHVVGQVAETTVRAPH